MIQKLKQLVKFVQRLYKRDTRRISEKKKCSYLKHQSSFLKRYNTGTKGNKDNMQNLLIVNNLGIKTTSEICSKSTIQLLEQQVRFV